jgi:hypothetical protein
MASRKAAGSAVSESISTLRRDKSIRTVAPTSRFLSALKTASAARSLVMSFTWKKTCGLSSLRAVAIGGAAAIRTLKLSAEAIA